MAKISDLDFIAQVQNEPVLWDPSAYGYNTSSARNDAWVRVGMILNLSSKV